MDGVTYPTAEHWMMAEKARLFGDREAFDADARPGSPAEERDALVAAAGEALWYFVVQREVLGIPDTEGMMRQLGVPREVRLRMGLNRRRDP